LNAAGTAQRAYPYLQRSVRRSQGWEYPG
jgi:hypothetical protein